MAATATQLMSLFSVVGQLKEVQRHNASIGVGAYRPHTKQDMFHRCGKLKYRYARTGNRFGKSDMGVAEDIAFAIGERPWYPESDSARYDGIPKAATKGLILCTDWEKAKEVFTDEAAGLSQGKIWKWLPKSSFVRRETNHSGNISSIIIKSRWGGESVIRIDTIASWKHNDQKGESANYDWIHVDEPIPQRMFNSFARGLMDRNGKAWFTCTPLSQPWINRFFMPSNRIILDKSKPNYFQNKRGDIDRMVLIGSSFDNPFNSQAGMAAYLEGLTESEVQARLYGTPLEQTGLVHPDFSEEHIYDDAPYGWRDAVTPPLSATVRVHIDCHPQTPHALLFAATVEDGTTYFFNEVFDPDFDSVVAAYQEIIGPYFCPVTWMDPSGWVSQMVDKTSFADHLGNHGIYPEKASKNLAHGIILSNQLLREPGRLKFGRHLTRTIEEFEMYVYDDIEKRPNKPVDKDDHMMEGFHRLCIGGLDYLGTQAWNIDPVSYGQQNRPNPLLRI